MRVTTMHFVSSTTHAKCNEVITKVTVTKLEFVVTASVSKSSKFNSVLQQSDLIIINVANNLYLFFKI